MTCEYTWPNHLMATDREAAQALLEQHGFQDDVAYGHSKVFIRTPRTLFCLEQERAQLIPIIVLLLQKVGWRGVTWGCHWGDTGQDSRLAQGTAWGGFGDPQGMGPAPGSPKHSRGGSGDTSSPAAPFGAGAALWGPSPLSLTVQGLEPGTALLAHPRGQQRGQRRGGSPPLPRSPEAVTPAWRTPKSPRGWHVGGDKVPAALFQAWRGALARRRCRYLRAAYTIMSYYKRHKVKAYLRELLRRFQGVRAMPDFGKSLAWPVPPAVLERFQENSQQLFRRCQRRAGVRGERGLHRGGCGGGA